jgi:hypothetical protein
MAELLVASLLLSPIIGPFPSDVDFVWPYQLSAKNAGRGSMSVTSLLARQGHAQSAKTRS